jgi:hypothetical protein
VAVALSSVNFKTAKAQFVVGSEISELAQQEIQTIINELSIFKGLCQSYQSIYLEVCPRFL